MTMTIIFLRQLQFMQDIGSDFEDSYIFPGIKDDSSIEDEGNEERINENTNDSSPLSSGSPTNTYDTIN